MGLPVKVFYREETTQGYYAYKSGSPSHSYQTAFLLITIICLYTKTVFLMRVRFWRGQWWTYWMNHCFSTQSLEKWVQPLQMDFQYMSKIWQLCSQRNLAESLNHSGDSRELSQPLLSLVGWRVEDDADGLSVGSGVGHFARLLILIWDFLLMIYFWCTFSHLCHLSPSLLCFASSFSYVLSSVMFFYRCVSNLFCPQLSCLSGYHWIIPHLPTLPYVSKFSPVLFLPLCLTSVWNWATSLTPSLEITAALCASICVSIFSFTLFFF